MKRALAMVLALVMMIGCLSGCGNNTKETEAQTEAKTEAQTEAKTEAQTEATTAAVPETEEKEWFGTEDGKTVTLHFWGGVQPEYGYDELCANFNEAYKDKGVQVEYTRYVNDTAGNLQLETYLMGSGDVDVFMGYGGRTTLNKRVESNLVLEMTDYLKEYDFDLVEELGAVNMQNYWFENDRVYAFPTKYENSQWVMINVDMFNEAGVEIPYDGWTYSEFLAAVEKLTHGEGQDKVYGVCWTLKQWFSGVKGIMGSTLGSYSTYKNDDCTEVNYDHEVWRAGLEMLNSCMVNGWAVPIEDEYSENATVANTFLEGKCAITTNISQMRLVMDTTTYPHDFVTALVPGPVPDGYETVDYKTHTSATGAGDLICIAQNTAYPEAAFEFCIWYLTGGMAPLAKGGRIPLWNGFDQELVVAAIKENAGDVMDEQALRNYLSIDNSKGQAAPSALWASSEISSVFKEEVEALCYGRQSVDDTINNLVTRSNKLIDDAIAAAGASK